MPSIPPTRSHLTHALFRARPGLDAFVEDHILKMTSDLAALNPIRLDELTFYGSAAHDTDEPRRPPRRPSPVAPRGHRPVRARRTPRAVPRPPAGDPPRVGRDHPVVGRR